MKKKRRKKTPDEKAAHREMIRKLEERIAYHEAKLAKERAVRGEDVAELTASVAAAIVATLMLFARI
ncbi:MAG: hypothetical protein ACRDPV_08485 [Gaiellaceae bacterium]